MTRERGRQTLCPDYRSMCHFLTSLLCGDKVSPERRINNQTRQRTSFRPSIFSQFFFFALWPAGVYFPSLSHFRPQIGFPWRACLYAAGSRLSACPWRCCSPHTASRHVHTALKNKTKRRVAAKKSELPTVPCLCAHNTHISAHTRKNQGCAVWGHTGVSPPAINTLIWGPHGGAGGLDIRQETDKS